MKTVPVIELSGTPFDMGLAHGRALKNLIREFVDSVTEVHRMNNGYLSVDKPPLETFCMKNLGFLEKFSPDLVEEMRGIAEGAGVTFREILYLNSFLELEDLRGGQGTARRAVGLHHLQRHP
jgi:isopenicillin-N N-acyltransferase-like protein